MDSLLKEAQPQISELTFTNLFVWNASESVKISQFSGTVLIQRRRLLDGKTFLLPPLEKNTLLEIVRNLRALNLEVELPPFYGFTLQQVQQLESELEKVQPDRDDWDYVYLTRDLADLPGDKYHPKRNFISRCLSKYECRYADIGPEEIQDCLQLQTRWCNLRNCSEVQGLEAEDTAIRTAFENYERLGIFGGAVYVDDRLEAFTLSEPLNDDTAVVHFEKANPEIEGLYQLVNQWFCQKALGKFKYVNREQDLGEAGLRSAKLSYHPHRLVEKFRLRLIGT